MIRNATSFFFFGSHCIGAKALETKWMHLYHAYLTYFAQFWKKFHHHGFRSYANLYGHERSPYGIDYFFDTHQLL